MGPSGSHVGAGSYNHSMTVLIDPPAWPAHGMLWSHLVSDASLDELHAFAAANGIQARAFDLDHYDVPDRRYDELVAEPKQTIEKIYRELNLPLTPEYESVLSAEQEQARRHRGSHAYGLDEFGLGAGEIRAALGELFERFHWQDIPPANG